MALGEEPIHRANQGLFGEEHTRATYGAVARCPIAAPGDDASAGRISCPDRTGGLCMRESTGGRVVHPTTGSTTSLSFH